MTDKDLFCAKMYLTGFIFDLIVFFILMPMLLIISKTFSKFMFIMIVVSLVLCFLLGVWGFLGFIKQIKRIKELRG